MNLRPSGYEPDELPDCSIPRRYEHLSGDDPMSQSALFRATHNIERIDNWVEMDSNHRSNLQQIYSLSPLATRESIQIKL